MSGHYIKLLLTFDLNRFHRVSFSVLIILVSKGSIAKSNKRVFIKDLSVFAPWKEDNRQILEKVCEHDFENWKLLNVIKDARDVS